MADKPNYIIEVSGRGRARLAPYWRLEIMLIEYSMMKRDGLTPRVFSLHDGLPENWVEQSEEEIEEKRKQLFREEKQLQSASS